MNPPRASAVPEVRALCCCNCKTHLGVYTSIQLQIGTALFERSVTIRCLCCRYDNRWAPAAAKKEHSSGG